MKIAVEGCCHGELDKIYETIQFLEKKESTKVDLLLCCGDFQAVRNEGDMKCMAVPPKYRQMQTFYKYYSGEKKAPVLTIFIGGNHEASNYLQELPYGGWVAPNIYYIGYAGVVKYRGMRIGGISGIFKPHDYRKGHFECPPYNKDTIRSAYHVRNIEVFKLKQNKTEGELPKATKFLALDKCLPHRDFLQIVEVKHDPSKPDSLEYDLEWLCVLKATKDLLNVTAKTWHMPENNGLHKRWDYSTTEQAREDMLKDLGHDLTIPCNFSVTIPSYNPNNPQHKRVASHLVNPQTTEFCARFGLIDINAKLGQDDDAGELDAPEDDVDSSGSVEDTSEYSTDTSFLSSSINPDEITLDDDDDNEENTATSVEPSPEYNPSFSSMHILPDSMAVSSDDAMDSESSQTEGEGKNSEVQRKRLSDENGKGGVRIKRRNQAIYTAQDEDK